MTTPDPTVQWFPPSPTSPKAPGPRGALTHLFPSAAQFEAGELPDGSDDAHERRPTPRSLWKHWETRRSRRDAEVVANSAPGGSRANRQSTSSSNASSWCNVQGPMAFGVLGAPTTSNHDLKRSPERVDSEQEEFNQFAHGDAAGVATSQGIDDGESVSSGPFGHHLLPVS